MCNYNDFEFIICECLILNNGTNTFELLQVYLNFNFSCVLMCCVLLIIYGKLIYISNPTLLFNFLIYDGK